MKKKTEYRITTDGYDDHFLEYHTHITLFFFWKIKFWLNVPIPYFDKIGGAVCSNPENSTLNGSIKELKDFANKWVYVEDYLEVYEKEMNRLIKISEKYHDELYAKEDDTIYL